MGIATHRIDERISTSLGDQEQCEIEFERSHNVCNGGVLFLLPALLSQGLLKSKSIYGKLRKGYYGFMQIIILLSFMALSRIKNPEQLKNCSPGEWGKILGMDRIPEKKCLRNKISEIIEKGKASDFNIELGKEWVKQEGTTYFYVDGHIQVYHGKKANLGKKHIARQKLCMPGITEFWVNNHLGMPYLVVTGEVNEKLQEIILTEILPQLKESISIPVSKEALEKDPLLPRFILVFDREAYSPSFFKKLWQEHRVAVITYNKNVKDNWSIEEFKEVTTEVIGKEVKMDISEREINLEDMKMREIRKLNPGGHQTSIISTDFKISKSLVAGKMFSRWGQENFFRYLRQDYDLDRIVEYDILQIDKGFKVVNPAYSKLTYKIKKIREKISRRQAKLYQLIDKNIEEKLDLIEKYLKEQFEIKEELDKLEKELDKNIAERKKHNYHIKIGEMPEEKRYNKLKTEGKLFMNTMKMICYRAETAFTNLINQYYKKGHNEGRMLAKEIIKSDADILPDYEKQELTVRLHSLSTPRANRAVVKMCELLNNTETKYPGTNLRLIYKSVT